LQFAHSPYSAGMPRKLNNWSYQDVTDFLKENGFSFFEELKGPRQAWIKLQEGGEPDRIVEIRFRSGNYTERIMKSIIRQSGIGETDWTEWAGS
jgi:hypothetical protein